MSGEDPERYLNLIRELARPTEAQMHAFAGYVAQDHSWYKKLPLTGAGEPFFLYLDVDPHAARVQREDGGYVARHVIREVGERGFYEYRIDLHPGDVEPGQKGPLHYLFGGIGTAEYRERFGGWTYWNHGPPDQPRDEALDAASAGLRAFDRSLQAIPVPSDVLDLGLVYLRATISGELGPTRDEHAELQAAHGLPDPLDDQQDQLDALVAAMQRVTARIFDGAR